MSNVEIAFPIVSHVVAYAEPAAAEAAVCIDRDGVVNTQQTGKYVHSWQDFSFLPNALETFVALRQAGVPTFIVTNQGGVGRGFVSATALEAIHDQMAEAIYKSGGRLDAIIHCPHSPEAGCPCRKPKPGMLFTLANQFHVRLDSSTFIGDNVTDLEAGRDAGCRTILVATGEGRRSAKRLGLPDIENSEATPVVSAEMVGLVATAPNLYAAVSYILQNGSTRP